MIIANKKRREKINKPRPIIVQRLSKLLESASVQPFLGHSPMDCDHPVNVGDNVNGRISKVALGAYLYDRAATPVTYVSPAARGESETLKDDNNAKTDATSSGQSSDV